MEEESAGVLPFLEVSVSRPGATLSRSIYRKPTFSGLGTSYFSNIFEKFKLCAVQTLIHRTYYLCSSFSFLHREILFLSGYFRNNGFPTIVIDSHVRRFLNKIHSPKPSPCSIPRVKFYFTLPFYNDSCHDRVRDLISTLERFYPQLHFLPSLPNPFTVGSFFKFKDALPNDLRSGVVYKSS